MRLKAPKPKRKMYQVVLVVLVMPVELVEVTKICQVPESWKNGQRPILLEQSILVLEPKRPSSIYKKILPKLQFFRHFNSECYILKKTNVLGYTISRVLSHLISKTGLANQMIYKSNDQPNQLSEIGQWHLVAFISRKMISIETNYKTHNQKLLAIIKACKTWNHYLEGCKYKVFVLTDDNNLRWFMETKSLNSCQVR